MQLIESFLKGAGPACFLAIQGSCIRTALSIQKQRSVGDLSPLPFVILFTNCIVWSVYGLQVKDMTVLVPNAIGILSALFCSFIFDQNVDDKPVYLYIAAMAIVSLTFLVNTISVGKIGCVLAVLTCGSPLSTIKTVIKNKSTRSMPFPTSALFFLNALFWTLYGLQVSDSMIYGPNALGLGFASVQMSLFIMYGFTPNPSLSTKRELV